MKKDERRNSDLVVYENGDNRPHLEIQIDDLKVRALLDSGSNVTILGGGAGDVIQHLGLEKIQEQPGMIITADGTEQPIKYTLNIVYTFNGLQRLVKTLVIPAIKKPLVLGMDFWEAFNITPSIFIMSEEDKPSVLNAEHVLTTSQTEKLQRTIEQFAVSEEGYLGCTSLVTHHINTGNAAPKKHKNYPCSPYMQLEINTEIERMLKLNVIEKADCTPWLNPLVATRKASGKVRLCLDARYLNTVTEKDAYPLPNINRILGRLTGTRFLSSIDLSDAFWQVILDEDSRNKTAFAISGSGFYRFCRMPFGLCNSAATMCKLMDLVLGCDLEPKVFGYLDDVIVASGSFEEHLALLEEVASRLRAAGLTINVTKSKFCMTELKYLGYIVKDGCISVDSEKVSAIVEYPTPKSVKEVRRLLGMAGWYRRFIKQFAEITAPMTDLLKGKNVRFIWTEAAEQAFRQLKECLSSTPVLANPRYDLPFIIQADASDTGMGAVLAQNSEDGESEHAVAFFSQKFTSAQRKYHTTERECLAVLSAIEKFRPFIEGVPFTVITDHASLLWLQNLRDPAGRLGRWALRLQAYNFTLIHRKGKFNVVPDALSRCVNVISAGINRAPIDPWYRRLRDKVELEPTRYPQFRVENDTLYKYCGNMADDELVDYQWRVVVPKHERKNILESGHDKLTAAHGGFKKTLERVRRMYYWPRMSTDVLSYVNSCDVCKSSKPMNTISRTPMGKQRIFTRPWQAVAIDFVVLPPSNSGFHYLLVVVDCFSKFVCMKPLRTATSKNTIRFLEDSVFLVYSIPEVLISDNGKQLVSKDFKSFLAGYNIKQWLTSYYHPQANPAEATNKTIGNAVRSYVKDQHRNWDTLIPKITCALNNSFHTATKFTPYFINFGQHMLLDGRDYVHKRTGESDPDGRANRLARIREQVQINLTAAYERSKKYYDRKISLVEFEPGEIVWKRNFVLSNADKGFCQKLAPNYIKCKIVEKLGTSSYRLCSIDGKDLGIASSKDLKKTYIRPIRDVH